MKLVENTLYAQTSGLGLSLAGEAIRVSGPSGSLQTFPTLAVSSLVVFSGVGITAALMEHLVSNGKSVYLVSRSGKLKMKAEGPCGRSVLLRLQQYAVHQDDQRRLALAKIFVVEKINAQCGELYRLQRSAGQRGHHVALAAARQQLTELGVGASGCGSLFELLGFEGQAAKVYFHVWGKTLKPLREGVTWTVRTRRPPRSPEDALLSFGYALLMLNYDTALQVAGLDPYVGYLHSPSAGRAALALDLMEPSRPAMVDAWVSTMCARREIRMEHFEPSDGTSFFLSDDGRRTFLQLWQKHMDGEVALQGFTDTVPLRFVPLHRARLLARALREGTIGVSGDFETV